MPSAHTDAMFLTTVDLDKVSDRCQAYYW